MNKKVHYIGLDVHKETIAVSINYLGDCFRRWKARLGTPKAITAMARKLAELFWRLMVHGITCVEQGLKNYEAKVAQTEQRLLQKLARKYNLLLQQKVP
jgi:transposase